MNFSSSSFVALLLSIIQVAFAQYGNFRLTEMYSFGNGYGAYSGGGPSYSQMNFPYTNYYGSSGSYGGPAYAGAYYNDPFYYTNNYRPSGYRLPTYAPYYQPFGLWNTRRSGHSDRYGGNNGYNWGCFPNKC